MIEEQGTVDPQDIRDGLVDVEYESASGWEVSFDESGNNEAFSMVVNQWEEVDGDLENVTRYTSDTIAP